MSSLYKIVSASGLVVAGAVAAEAHQVILSGVVTSAAEPSLVGASMTAAFDFAETSSRLSDDGNSAVYYFDEAVYGYTLLIGPYQRVVAGGHAIRIMNDFVDVFEGYAFIGDSGLIAFDDFPIQIENVYAEIYSAGNLSLLSNNHLPVLEIPIELFDFASFSIEGAGSEAITGVITSYVVVVSIPEPSSFGLTGGLLALSATFFRRRLQRKL